MRKRNCRVCGAVLVACANVFAAGCSEPEPSHGYGFVTIQPSGGLPTSGTGGVGINGSGGTFAGTGGDVLASGGAVTVSGGSQAQTGGTALATGGSALGSGGVTDGTGGVTASSGGQQPGTGGSLTATGGEQPNTGGSATTEPRPTALSISVTTDSPAAFGRYRPRNCGAIWIEDSQGNFVQTIKVWAQRRRNTEYMPVYMERTDNNVVDAITGPTLSGGHQTHEVTWDLTDASGAEVPDGQYTVWMLVTEGQRGGGPTMQVDFVKGDQPLNLDPPAQDGFSKVALRLE